MQDELKILSHAAGVELHYNNDDNSYYSIVNGYIFYHYYNVNGIEDISEIIDIATIINIKSLLAKYKIKLNATIEDLKLLLRQQQ